MTKKSCQNFNFKSNISASPSLDARQLKARVDLTAFVGQFTRLRRAGRQFLGLCPLHKERHPSFYVHPEKKIFYCFGCGVGGDVFEFVMRVTGCNFRRALEITAEFSGVARASDPRSGSRFGASEGASPPAAKRPGTYSKSMQESRAQILALLEATDRRLRAIEATNLAASAALATACEPDRTESPLLEKTG